MLRDGSGLHFDAELVKAFLTTVVPQLPMA